MECHAPLAAVLLLVSCAAADPTTGPLLAAGLSGLAVMGRRRPAEILS